MTRQKIWLGFLDWLRPVGREASASPHETKTSAASTELTSPFASGGREAVLDGAEGASTRRDLAVAMFADETMPESDEVELREFLAGDHDPVTADPVFREQLSDRLWKLVEGGGITRPKDH